MFAKFHNLILQHTVFLFKKAKAIESFSCFYFGILKQSRIVVKKPVEEKYKDVSKVTTI